MSPQSHNTVRTQHVDVGDVRYAYRRFGREQGVPLIFLQHFRGGMDHWDPRLTDGLAAGRPVILFDNAGVAGSSGEVPGTMEEMGAHVAVFLDALQLKSVDVLGFSIGGCVAQALTLQRPDLVRRLVLVGTGPRGGEPLSDPLVPQIAGNPVPVEDDFLYLFFTPSRMSQAAGRAFWARRHERTIDLDPPSTMQAAKAQSAALREWATPKGERFADLKKIGQPTLVVNGTRDIMIPTINSYHLVEHLPDAQLVLLPDAGHGSQFQYPELFLQITTPFLDDKAVGVNAA